MRAGQDPEVDEGLLDALAAILADKSLEPAFVAEALTPPSEADIAREIGRDVDPDAIFRARAALRALIGLHLNAALTATYESLAHSGPYSPDAVSAGRRLLKNVCLDLLAATQESHAIRLAAKQYQAADNMTDRMAALGTLSLHDVPERKAAFEDFYQRYQDDPLIIDKWFVLAGDDARSGDARPRSRADRASGVLDDQPQPRALADRLVRARQSDAVQPRRRRWATNSSPTASWRSIRTTRRSPRG